MRRSILGGLAFGLVFGLICVLASGSAGAQTAPPFVAYPVDPGLPAYVPSLLPAPAAGRAPAGWRAADGAVRIGGAEHVEFIVTRFNALYTRSHPGTTFRFESRGTTSAMPLLTFDQTLFGAMGRAVNPLEQSAYRKIVGEAPLEIRVAYTSDDTSAHLATSLAVYVHRSNPLAEITPRQVARMLSIGNPEGDYSRWGQLGLQGAWARRAIHPYGTPEYTGFGDYLQSQQLRHLPLAPAYEAYGNTADILDRLRADPAGIAVAAIGLSDSTIKALPIRADDGAAPTTTGTAAEVISGRYPYGRALYFYVRKQPGQPLDPLVREYLRLVLSQDGQAIVASQPRGYIPLSAADAQQELAKLDRADR